MPKLKPLHWRRGPALFCSCVEDYLSGQTCDDALMETKECSVSSCPSQDCSISARAALESLKLKSPNPRLVLGLRHVVRVVTMWPPIPPENEEGFAFCVGGL